MFGSEVLEVAIAIVFVFLLVSILASAIREGIEGWLKTRAAHLEAGIRELLQDPNGTGLTKDLFEHPLVYSLYAGKYTPRASSDRPGAFTSGGSLPSYIPSRNFALALLDLAARGPVSGTNVNQPLSRPVSLQTVRANLNLLENLPVQRVLLTAIDSAEGDLQKAQANIEAWYDSTMDRVSGWYKRSTQRVLLALGLAIAVSLNVNTIDIGNFLYLNKTAREAVVARAKVAAEDSQYRYDPYQKAQKELDNLSLPIGGTNRLESIRTRPLQTLGGWLLTAVAASFGAPFWFDILNRFMVIRSTVKPHQKSPEESSEDSQSKSSPAPNFAMLAPGFSANTAHASSNLSMQANDGARLPEERGAYSGWDRRPEDSEAFRPPGLTP